MLRPPWVRFCCLAALVASTTGCADDVAPNPVGYRHSGADTLQVLVPVCDGEKVTEADLQQQETTQGAAPPLGIDIPAKDGFVDFLIGYPSGSTPYSKDLRLTVTSSRTRYDVRIPAVDRERPTGQQWQRSGDGKLVTRTDLTKAVQC